MEEALMRKTRLTRSGCYKVAMEDFYFKHFPKTMNIKLDKKSEALALGDAEKELSLWISR
jgi:hypothetical protein